MTEPATHDRRHVHLPPGSAPSSFSARYPWLMAHDYWLLAWVGFSLLIVVTSQGRGTHGLEWILVILIAFIGSIVHALLLLIGWLSTSFRSTRPSFRHPLENWLHLVWVMVWLSLIAFVGFKNNGIYIPETYLWTMVFCSILATIGHLAVANVMSYLCYCSQDAGSRPTDWTPVSLAEPAGHAGFCPFCGHPRSGEYRFCSECGEELPPHGADPAAVVPAAPKEKGPDFLEITIRPQTIVLLIILAVLLVIYLVAG